MIVVVVILGVGLSSAPSEACNYANTVVRTANGELLITAPDCGVSSGVDVSSYMISAKGSYANAMTIANPVPTTNTCLSSSPNLLDCAGYSFDCKVCGADPNGYPGEISCFCISPTMFPRNRHRRLPENQSVAIASQLWVDTNADGQLASGEPVFSSNPAGNNGSNQVRYYELHNQLWLAEWEDQFMNGNGDFNDYAAVIEPRICNGLPFPVLYNEGGACAFTCAAETDPLCGEDIIRADAVSFHAAVGVDSETSEGDREGRGRLLRVAVSTYYRRFLANRKFATCPSLVVKTKSNTVPPLAERFDYGVQPNDAGVCQPIGAVGDTPQCRTAGPNPFAGSAYPIALAREQFYKASDACAPNIRTVSDDFTASGFGTCKEGQEGGHTELYEISLDMVNNAAATSELDFIDPVTGQMQTAAEILGRISYVYVLFVQDPPAGFHCPSGVNAAIGAFDLAGTVNAFDRTLPVPSPSVRLYTRD